MKSLILYPNNPMQFSLPHSIAQLSACAKLKGDEVELFDTTFYRTKEQIDDIKRMDIGGIKPFNRPQFIKEDVFEAFQKKVDEFQPDRILLSVVDNTKELGRELLKSLDRHVHTVVGGVSVILNQKEFLKDKIYDEVHTGEARDYFFNQDLSVHPFDDWTIFPEDRMKRPMDGKYYKTLPFITENGCPFSCGFCCAPRLREKMEYGQKDINFIRKEMDFQMNIHDPEFVYFSSETLLTRNFTDIYYMYMRYRLPFWCQTHVSTITENRCRKLKEMNCHRVAIGIECGNPVYRREMIGKNFSNGRAIESFRLLYKHGINASANNIIGLPDETPSMIADTVALNRELYRVHPDMQINCYIYQPYYGTRLRDYCVEHNLLLDEPDTVMGMPVIQNNYIENKDIVTMRDEFVELVKNGL